MFQQVPVIVAHNSDRHHLDHSFPLLLQKQCSLKRKSESYNCDCGASGNTVLAENIGTPTKRACTHQEGINEHNMQFGYTHRNAAFVTTNMNAHHPQQQQQNFQKDRRQQQHTRRFVAVFRIQATLL
jgi:hypothetical protein